MKWYILTVILLSISITSIYAKSFFNLQNAKRENGVKLNQEGVLVDLQSKNDKQSIFDSIDPITGSPSKKLQAKAINNDIQKKHLIAEDTKKTLDVPYVSNDKKDVIIYDPVSTLLAVPIPNTNDYLVEFDNTIYKIDWKTGTLKKFLKDEVNGYKKDEIMSHHIEQVGTPSWGSMPVLNPSGTYLLFFSGRSMVNGDPNGETWVKNIQTGDEHPVLSGGAGVIDWENDNTVILNSQNIISLDVKTGNVNILLDNGAMNVALVKDQIVYQTQPESLILQVIPTGEKTTVSNKLINRVGSLQTRGAWIAMLNQVSDTDSEFSVVLYNIDSKTWKLITAPENTWIDGVSWSGDSTLLVQTSTKGTNDETTYIVNIDEVEVVQ